MTTITAVLPLPQLTQPRVLLVKWHSGDEEIDLGLIDAARQAKAAQWTTTIRTHEQRKGTGRVVVYDPTLKIHSNGFALKYDDEGYWADDDDMLQNAEGEKGQAVYSRYEDGKWKCFWYAAEDSTVPHEFQCKELGTGREWRQADVRVSNAKFRKAVLAGGEGCIVTGESNPAALDAAHIYEVNSEGNDSALNGIAMRKDIHWLFDRGIITIDSQGTVTMSPILDSYKYLFKNTAHSQWKKEPKLNNLEGRLPYINLRKKQQEAKKNL